MGEGWSTGRSDLIPSNGPVTHPDQRMHLKIGTGDLDPYPVTRRDPPPPLREPIERELFAAAVRMAKKIFEDGVDAVIVDLKRGSR